MTIESYIREAEIEATVRFGEREHETNGPFRLRIMLDDNRWYIGEDTFETYKEAREALSKIIGFNADRFAR